MIKLIVGLGNPGSQYDKTRHNAGFVFLDHLLSAYGGSWVVSSQFQGETAVCSIAGSRLILLKPMTFMNRSGLSVGNLMRYYKFKPEELLVVHDELDLPAGAVRLKRDGGHAGHNGLRDIIAHLQSRDFFRLRMGIDRPAQGGNVADYVLSKPSAENCRKFDALCENVIGNIELLIAGKAQDSTLLP
ncbi:MAG: aminoacyl-tRNA hydrolase [Methylococcales bacterium]|nr:aminoacyl-tRNA hydrolase [Methylococcales bacterium]